MNLEEIKINTIEILRYLGYGGQILDEQIKDDIKFYCLNIIRYLFI